MLYTWTAVAMSKIYEKIKRKIKFPKSIKDNEKILLELKKIFNDEFFYKNFIKEFGKVEKKEINPNSMYQLNAYKPQIKDLYRIFQFVILNKRTTILEFGSGWSTLIFSIAMSILEEKFGNKILALRRSFPFKVFSVDNEKKYLNISKKRIENFYKNITVNNTNFHYSDCRICLYENKFCIEYDSLPNCNPDFIYIDGPDIFNVKDEIQNISYKNKDLMPIICDILKFEYFLIPGTMIVLDGRTANAQFLSEHFKRNWIYYYDKENDQNLFYLDSPSLGRINDLMYDFYTKKD